MIRNQIQPSEAGRNGPCQPPRYKSVATDLFLGGWHGPWLPEWLGWIWFLAKVGALLFFYIWMRWTLPRYRYDQLMEFGWKWLLPAAVVNLLVTAYLTITINGW